MEQNTHNEQTTFWKEFWRTVKYFLIAASAGLIQFGVCTICDELIFKSLDHKLYWMFYFIALVLSVLWNFTINRKVTFKSVGNIPKAMLKVLGYYVVYTPLSLQFAWVAQNKWNWPEVVITITNILINGVTEYLFMRLFVFRKEIDSALKEKEEKKEKRRRGDRRDAKLIRDIDGIHVAMAQLYGGRCQNEAYISEQVDLAPLKTWMEKHPDEEFKYTFFHIIVAALLKLLVVRPKLNRFISNRHYYQKNERSIGFIVKRQFSDDAGEGMAIVKGEEKTTIFDVHEAIKKQVIPCKQGKNSGTEDALDIFKKLPHWLTCIVFNTIMRWSKKGKLPKSLVEGDSNHCSAFVTNLGSIGLKCGYHHLAEYGTNSLFVVIGKKQMTPFYDEKGKITMKETLDLGLTVDERIADGYYYAKSMKILRKVLENPELLELPFDTEVEI